ncbi:MAG: ureidoglycolate lyase [Dongiaceae bacterium]
MATLLLPVAPLTRAAFAPFGEVIETDGRDHRRINDGFAERYHDLARIDVAAQGGRPLLNIFRATPWPMPVRVRMVERHPLSSQAFMPLSAAPFLVVVAAPDARPSPADLRAFRTNGRQGVNFARGTWHHPLLALDGVSDFLVIDRGGPGEDCDETHFPDAEILVDLAPG